MERGAATSPDKRALYGNSVGLIRGDRCGHAESSSSPLHAMPVRLRANICNAVTRKVFLLPTIPHRLTNSIDLSRVSLQLRRKDI